MTPEARSLAGSINDFTFRLIAKTGAGAQKNALISPYSIVTVLSTLVPGTTQKDQSTLMHVLAPEMTAEGLQKGSGDLSQQMLRAEGHPLGIANSVWAKDGIALSASYINSIQTYFASEIHSFARDRASVTRINRWADEKTKHRISQIIDRINTDDVLFLVNAISFDGIWSSPFLTTNTRLEDFHHSSGATKKVWMMNSKRRAPYYRNDSLRATLLDYQGDDFGMLLMLPEKDRDAGALLRSMTSSGFATVLNGLRPSDRLPIAIPRFKFSDSYELKNPLSEIGLGPLFSGADFSPISPQLTGAFISRVVHKTFIDVDEEGTRAAAVTRVAVRKSARVHPPEFRADRPFAFFIVHRPTQAILFAGVVNDPQQG